MNRRAVKWLKAQYNGFLRYYVRECMLQISKVLTSSISPCLSLVGTLHSNGYVLDQSDKNIQATSDEMKNSKHSGNVGQLLGCTL
eukprot:m.1184 g.1184  ORF g.1184 m.1184 type:complete len:85 (+) comp5843_c0_seq1:124-378(+)